ncbi:MAG: DUF2341 domain-containing protein [Candidatus Aenigmarchaeota archaeon]|nr:DUF2341 domain-containing protein [Candidatus Aenigmarchaeota archaeon]
MKGVLTAAVFLAFLSLTPAVLAQSQSWWNTDWEFRKQITIVNNNLPIPEGYTVAVKLDTTGFDFLDNGNDVRILFNNQIEIDRINDSSFNTSATTLLFKTQTPILAEESASNYWVYYGNPSAQSPPANPKNVFSYYENFNNLQNGPLNGQDSWAGSASAVVSEVSAWEGAKALNLLDAQDYSISRNIPQLSNYVISARILKAAPQDTGATLQLQLQEGSTLLTAFHIDANGVGSDLGYYTPSSSYKKVGSFDQNKHHGFTAFVNNGKMNFSVTKGDSLEILASDLNLDLAPSSGPNAIRIVVNDQGGKEDGNYMDTILYRKLVIPEPTTIVHPKEVQGALFFIDTPKNKSYITPFIEVNVSVIDGSPVISWQYSLNNGPQIPFVPNITIEVPDGFNNLTVVATSGSGESSLDSVGFTANLNPPEIAELSDIEILEDAGVVDNLINLEDVVTDAESAFEHLSFSLQQSSTSIITCAIDQVLSIDCQTISNQYGSTTVTLAVSDGDYVSGENFSINVLPVNDPPILIPIPDKQVAEGSTLIFKINATDTDNDTLTYSTNAGDVLPSPFFFDSSTGTFNWTPTYYDGGANLSVTFSVTDGQLSDEKTISIVVVNINDPPQIVPTGDKIITEGQFLSFKLKVFDPDGNILINTSNAAENIPGAKFSAGGQFNWTPTYTDYGQYNVTFTVFDGVFTVSETITITVLDAPTATLNKVGAPVMGNTVTFFLSDTAAANQFYVLALSFSNSTGIPLGDGRYFPLDPDLLFSFSVLYGPTSIGLQNSLGTFSSTGNAIVTWTIPKTQALAGKKVYAAFASINNSMPFPKGYISLSPALEMTIIS